MGRGWQPVVFRRGAGPDGSFALYGLDAAGGSVFHVPLPPHGHAGKGHPSLAEAVACARRPGSVVLVLDCARGGVLHRLTPPAGRRFNGHGVFSGDGSALFTSEQRNGNSQGVIGIWEVYAGYSRHGEFRSGGIGPHDLRLMPDGATLVVAKGGIATEPTDRRKLNLDRMRPNPTDLSLSGPIREQVEPEAELRQSSIRHLAVRHDGLIGFAMQWESEPGAATPLLDRHRRAGTPVPAATPLGDEPALRGYAGSLAFSGDGSELAITSPRGDRVHRFGADGACPGAVSCADVCCGLAPKAGGSLASDGLGGLISVGAAGPRALARRQCARDNHIVALCHGCRARRRAELSDIATDTCGTRPDGACARMAKSLGHRRRRPEHALTEASRVDTGRAWRVASDP